MASRKLIDLHPILMRKAVTFKAETELVEVEILIYCTYRSCAEQDILFAQGRKTEGKIITWAKGGQSKHNHTENNLPASLAFDCVPMLHGRTLWEISPESLKKWQALEKIADKLGLEWGGHFKNGKIDRPHFQITL